MARFLGQQGRRLKRISSVMRYGSLVFALLLLGCGILILREGYTTKNPLSFFFLIFLMAPLLYFLRHQFVKADREFTSYNRGKRGEDNIREELRRHLSDEYACFHHVVLYKGRGDIDFVVVGPTGVYVIEVKNYRGSIRLRGGQLMKYGRPLQKDVLRQVRGQGNALQQFLYENLRVRIFVRKVVVFVGQTEVPFKLQPVNDVYVVHEGWLKDLIEETLPRYSFPIDRAAIEDAILAALEAYYKS